jgi:hypothetical protein
VTGDTGDDTGAEADDPDDGAATEADGAPSGDGRTDESTRGEPASAALPATGGGLGAAALVALLAAALLPGRRRA